MFLPLADREDLHALEKRQTQTEQTKNTHMLFLVWSGLVLQLGSLVWMVCGSNFGCVT